MLAATCPFSIPALAYETESPVRSCTGMDVDVAGGRSAYFDIGFPNGQGPSGSAVQMAFSVTMVAEQA